MNYTCAPCNGPRHKRAIIFITDTEYVYCAVQTEALNVREVTLGL